MPRQNSNQNFIVGPGYQLLKKMTVSVYKTTSRGRRHRLNLFLFMVGFIYLNYRFNFPVFHVFRNKNIQAPCFLPKFDFYDSSIQQFFWKQQPLPCENWLDLFFVDKNGFIMKNETAVRLSGYIDIKCEYRYVQRLSEIEMTFSSKAFYTKPTYMAGDFLHMECFDTQLKRVYNNLHINIDTKSVLRSRQLINESESELSVYIVGIDSISRLIAERKLRKTMHYLRTNLSAYIMKGYTRIADSSYPNIVPIFTGLKGNGKEDRVGVNNLSYIFKDFSRRGSVDLWAEDWYKVASFKGFKEQPTQHYIQPLLQAMDETRPPFLPLDMTLKFLQNHNVPLSKVSALCFGNIYKFKILLQYYKRFIEAYDNKRKFGFSWTNELAHDFLNMAELGDDDYFEFFKWMKETNKLKNAVLIFMADHGPRYSEIQNTEVGRISNLLPLMSIVVPDHIKSKFRHIQRNLELNTERLTTPYDIYEMLKDILNANFEPKEPLTNDNSLPRGISLFQEIPISRSCKEADVSEHYCPCYSSINIRADDNRVVDSGVLLVNKINEILKNDQNKCAKVDLFRIRNSSLVFADMERDSKSERFISLRSLLWKVEERIRLRIQFITNPGHAAFEGTVQYNSKDNIQVLGDINRINRYGNQSACIEDNNLMPNRVKRLYCYCI